MSEAKRARQKHWAKTTVSRIGRQTVPESSVFEVNASFADAMAHEEVVLKSQMNMNSYSRDKVTPKKKKKKQKQKKKK